MKVYLLKKGTWTLLEDEECDRELAAQKISIGAGASIGEGASIGAAASIGAEASIRERATVNSTQDAVVLGPLGSRNAMLTGYRLKKGWRIATGCFDGTPQQFLGAVKKTHAGSRHEKEYLAATDYLRAKFAIR